MIYFICSNRYIEVLSYTKSDNVPNAYQLINNILVNYLILTKIVHNCYLLETLNKTLYGLTVVYKHHNNTIRLTIQHKAALTTCVYR